MHRVELSHVLENGATTYPGLPGPEISAYLEFTESTKHYAPGTEFSIGHVSIIANTGTYLDTPAHRYRDGQDLADLSLQQCAHLPTTIIDATGTISPSDLTNQTLTGHAVLLRTGWDQYWRTDRYGDPDHPHLTENGAQYLVDEGASLVGIDSVNIDDTTTGHRPAHTVLLRAGIPIVEHLTGLHALPTTGAHFTAVPPAVRGLATFPVRAFATIP